MQGQKRKLSVSHGSSDRERRRQMLRNEETSRSNTSFQDPVVAPTGGASSSGISSMTYRVRGIPQSLSHKATKSLINVILGLGGEDTISLKSLADDINGRSKVATICLQDVPEQFQQEIEEYRFDVSDSFKALGLSVDENQPTPSMVVDHHFIGLTTLSYPKSDEHKVE